MTPEKLESFDEADRRIRSTRPDIEALWGKSKQKRELSEFLLRARCRAGLNQSQLAERAGWDKSFVSRMESAFSPVPDLATISRYMAACGEAVGLTAFSPKDSSIIDAFPLDAAAPQRAEAQQARAKTLG